MPDAVTLAIPGIDKPKTEQGQVEQARLSQNSAEKMEALEEAKQLRRQLHETEAALQKATSVAEALAEEHKSTAYAEGFALGLKEGQHAGLAEFVEKTAALTKLFGAAIRLESQVLENAEDKAVEIVMEAVCKIIGKFAANESAVRKIVRESMAHLNGAKIGGIRLNPYDYEIIAASPAELGDGIKLISDEAIEIGGCVLESDAGILDRRLDAQIEQLKTLLLTIRKEAKASDSNVVSNEVRRR